jgi:dTDP-4-amino-4,6-dideoxygalactose transaminase
MFDLRAQYLSIQSEIDSAIARVLASGRFILDQEVKAFESEFARYCGVGHAIAVASGTDAIYLSLLACGIGRGDEVITSAHTAVATVAAIEMTGAQPVLVDIDPHSYSLDPVYVAKSISPCTRALVPVHLYGFPADLSPLLEIAHRNNLIIIEDCAQSLGARYHGKMVGTWGHIAAFSFYPTKNLGAYGDGGAVITNNSNLADYVRSFRQYGWNQQRVSVHKGINSRMDEFQAAILRVKLTHLEAWISRRSALAALYRSLLVGNGVVFPWGSAEAEPAYHLFVLRHEKREALRAFLAGKGIQTLVHYAVPIHLQPAYADLGYREGDFPETELASQEVLSLPFFPEMTDEMIRGVCTAFNEFFDGVQT